MAQKQAMGSNKKKDEPAAVVVEADAVEETIHDIYSFHNPYRWKDGRSALRIAYEWAVVLIFWLWCVYVYYCIPATVKKPGSTDDDDFESLMRFRNVAMAVTSTVTTVGGVIFSGLGIYTAYTQLTGSGSSKGGKNKMKKK